MADDANRVVVSIEAQTQQLEQGARRADQVFDRAMTDIERSASSAERQIVSSSSNSARSLERIRTSSGATRAGMQQLSFQLSDVAQGFALGVSPMTIFAQQSGQVVQALQLMGGEAKGIIGFLGGPWGIALSAAISVAGALATSLFHNEDAGKAAKRGFDAAADGADRLATAMKNITGIGTVVAQTDVQTVQDQISFQETRIAKLQYDLAHPPSVAEPNRATAGQQHRRQAELKQQLAEAKANLADQQAALKLAQSRLTVQQRIQAAQDKFNQSRTTSTRTVSSSGRGGSAPAPAQTYDIIAEAAKGADDAVQHLTGTIIGSSDAFTKAQGEAVKSILGAGDFGDIAKQAEAAHKAQQQAERQGEAEMQRVREDHVRTTAHLYYDLFSGGTHRLWQDFERMGLQIISRLLAEWTIGSLTPKSGGGGLLGSIAGALGLAGGGGGSIASWLGGGSSAGLGFGGPFTAIAGARASGGPVEAGRLYRVNEQGIEGFRPQGSGTIIPLDGMRRATAPNAGGVTVLQTVAVDARGAVMNDKFASMILERAGQQASQISAAYSSAAAQSAPAVVQRKQKLG